MTLLNKYDFDLDFAVDDDNFAVYDDLLTRAAVELDWMDEAAEMEYDVTVEGGDLSEMLSDGVAEVRIVGGEYDKADSSGNYFIDQGSFDVPLENEEVASFDIDAAISGGGFSSVSGASDVYHMQDGTDEMYAANVGPDTVRLSGPSLEDIELFGPDDHQYKVQLVDDSDNVLDESDWEGYDPDSASAYEEMNDYVPGQTTGVKDATKEVGKKYVDRLRNLF
ncbi:MAG: hypothetical protein SV186_06935 [Candidatus Nanohaloarchaea archaeon]|nr:hypothetical protein [Candidatus Nanohaloarchaea archaeon]